MTKMTKAQKKKRAAARRKAAAEKPPNVTPYPAAGPKVDSFEQKLDEHPGASDIPKPGRPPKPPEPEPAQVPNEIIRQAVQVPFDLWAISQKLKGLKLDDKEAAMLSEPVKTLLDYYLPQLPKIAIAWASVTISIYAVMKPRLEMIAEIKKQKKSADRDINQGKGPGVPIPPSTPPPAGQRNPTGFPEQLKITRL